MQGIQGIQGSFGIQGNFGIQGALGPQGIQGIQGLQGVQGLRSNVTVSETAPVSPLAGDLWFNCANGKTFIWYNDGTSSQWVEHGTNGPAGIQGIQGRQGTTGSQGSTGIQGIQGLQGLQGAQGIQGPSTVEIIQPSTNTTIALTDAGKYLNVSTGVTIDTSTSFSSGNVVSIYNSSAVNITITASGVTLRLGGTGLTGNRTLAQRGVATILCVGANDYVITGAGLT